MSMPDKRRQSALVRSAKAIISYNDLAVWQKSMGLVL
jgi:hypothetical protein